MKRRDSAARRRECGARLLHVSVAPLVRAKCEWSTHTPTTCVAVRAGSSSRGEKTQYRDPQIVHCEGELLRPTASTASHRKVSSDLLQIQHAEFTRRKLLREGRCQSWSAHFTSPRGTTADSKIKGKTSLRRNFARVDPGEARTGFIKKCYGNRYVGNLLRYEWQKVPMNCTAALGLLHRIYVCVQARSRPPRTVRAPSALQ